MKNYKITCSSIFIADLVYKYLSEFNDFHNHKIGRLDIINKGLTFSSVLNLDDLYSYFAGTPFEIVIQELDDNGNLVRQRMTP